MNFETFNYQIIDQNRFWYTKSLLDIKSIENWIRRVYPIQKEIKIRSYIDVGDKSEMLVTNLEC